MRKHQQWMETQTSYMERVKNLAVIPARSGSKGLKDKNIKLLNGKHLIGYSIEAAIKSGIFDCVHISTDNKEYAEIGKSYGADASFLRSKKLSTDTADTWDVVRYVSNNFQALGKIFDTITVLQPTSPLRTAEDIKNAYVLFKKKHAKSVISVCRAEHNPRFMKTLGRDLSMEGFVDLSRNVQRQKQEICYFINGAIYMLEVSVLDNISELYGKQSYAYIMPTERSVDIDTIQDFKYTEYLLQQKEGNTVGRKGCKEN